MSEGMRGGAGKLAGSEKYKIRLKGNKVMKKLLGLAKPSWKSFLLALAIILILAVIEILRPNIIRLIIDDNIQKAVKGAKTVPDSIRDVTRLGLLFLGLMILQLFFDYCQVIILQKTGMNIILRLRNRLFAHVQKLPFTYFEKTPAGVIVTRITNDTEAINEMYTGVIVNFIKEMIVMLGILAVIFVYNYRMALLLLTIMPVVFIAITIFRKYARKVFNEIRNRLARVNAFLSEHIMGIKVIRVFNMTESKKNEFDEVSSDYKKSHDKMVALFGFFRPFMDFLNELAIVMIIWFGIREILNFNLGIGMLYMFIRYSNMLFQPVIHISEMFNTLQSSLVASERVFSILELEPEKNIEMTGQHVVNGDIEFKNVWFSYDKENWVLKDVSFKISRGEFVAFVGATGAGKTTIINLLCGFYEINDGNILIDGKDIRQIPKKLLRAGIGLVLQDVQLFRGNILDNIRLNADVPEEKVREVSKYVNADRFITKLSKGYESDVYYGGATFSNGERQLLSFARAVVKEPAILILDEATSNIDTETERIIQKSLKKISSGRTTVAIAHRLSTIRNADRIIVIHNGRIEETGNHSSLMKTKGVYFKLYTMQYSE